MKNYLSMLIAMLLLATFSCHHNEQNQEAYQNEAKQKIAELDKLYHKAWENENLDSTLLFYDDDFVNTFFINMNLNKEQTREGFQELFDNYSIEGVEYKTVEIFVDQNYAFETQLFKQKWITNDKKDTTYFDLRIMFVFKKQEDSNWKIFRFMAQQ
jgi:ketosteroid isomerase-like protein